MALTIDDAIADRKLFGSLPRFKSLTTWTAWLVVLKAIFGLPMTADDLVIFQKHTGRTTPPANGSKESFIICGRRGGKSFMTALVAVFIAAFGDFKDFITGGESLAVVCLARDKEQAKIVYKYIKAILNAVPILRSMIVAERADEIELKNGVTILVKTSDYRSIRGLTIVTAIADEISFWDAVGANPDREVLAAIRPGMMTIPTSKLLCISSPYAESGAMFDAFKSYYGKDDDDVLVWRADSLTMNPSLNAATIQKEIERDPEAGRSEWLAEFRADITAAFALELIESCIVPGRVQLPAIADGGHVGFTDPSGGRHDSWVTAIAHLSGDKIIVDAILATKPPFSPADTAREHSDFLKSYGVNGIIGDAYAGEFPRELFAKNGINYEVSDKNKSELYLNLIPAMTSRAVELLDNDKLKNELRRLERRRGRSGKDSIDHPGNGSDDVANAIAGAVAIALANEGAGVDDFLRMNAGAPTRAFSKNQPLDEAPTEGGSEIDRLWDSSRRGSFWDL